MIFKPIIHLIWHEPSSTWLVRDPGGYEMFRLWDCRNTNMKFTGLKKDKVNVYEFSPQKPLEYRDLCAS